MGQSSMSAHSPADQRILVIGAGPAGLAAAVTAAELGLRVVLVDEAAAAGGQYLSSHDSWSGDHLPASERNGAEHRFSTRAERDGAALIARAHALTRAAMATQLASAADARQGASLELRWGATVWSLGPNSDGKGPGLTAMVYSRAGDGREAGSECMEADAVVLATGARETVTPFPGWTLPGVMTVGAAQLLVKRHGVSPAGPGQRVLIAGSGPLLLPAAAKLIEAGAHILGVLEAVHVGPNLAVAPHSLSGVFEWAPALWDRRGESWHYLSAMRRGRVPYLFGRAVVRATGTDRVEAVDVARLDRSGAPLPGRTETWPVDLLCVGYGLAPNIELAQLAGARVIYSAALGGWAVEVDEKSGVRTNVPGLFVAGETAGISGASSALLSGRIAALSAAASLGRLPQAELGAELVRTARRRRQNARFGALVNLMFGAPDALTGAIPDDTPICRCEEVTAGEVRAAIAAGARSLDALKPALRVGQGLCQGRTCGPVLARLVAAETGRPVEAGGLFQARPPVRPVPLAVIAARRPSPSTAIDGPQSIALGVIGLPGDGQ